MNTTRATLLGAAAWAVGAAFVARDFPRGSGARLALAFIGTGVLGAGYGFLQNAGLPPIDWGAVIWPAMVGLWAIGYAVASRRYR